MNKDFLTKPISLKDIKIPKISIKDIKNNKLVIICIFVFIFFIGTLIVGFNLVDKREEAKSKQVIAENRYISLQSIPSKEKMEEEMILLKNQIVQYEQLLKPVKTRDFAEILKDFKKNAPIKWDDDNASYDISKVRGFEDFSIYKVDIKVFTGNLDDVEKFLTYVEEYEKIVKIDSLQFNKNSLTGNLTGQLSLSFYFDKLEE